MPTQEPEWLKVARSRGLVVSERGPLPLDLSPQTPPAIDPADEAEFQALVMTLARERGWLAYHTRDSRKSEPGFPDIIAIRPPVLVVAELKFGTNKTTPAQRAWLQAFALVGVMTYVWYPDSWEEILRVFK